MRFLLKRPLFLFCVAIPTLLATIYFGFIASDIYISESSFVVRTSEQQAAPISLTGAIAAGMTGATQTLGDSAAVNSYILSRDALRILEKELNLTEFFSAPTIDFLHRFGVFTGKEFEELYQYYLKYVSVIIGPNPGISTLKVRAFSADKAREINELLLKIAEEKVNQLNDRARQDLIRYAEVEVRDAEKRAADAALAVATYRNQRDVVNPEQQTQLHLSKISQLQMELLSTRTKLNQLEKLAPNSPAPASLELKQKAIESEIAMEKSRITGSEYSLASMAAEFEKLRLEQEFADRQLALALASLQNARQEAYRQQIYLERLATPSLPDIAMEPERMLAIATVFLLGLICWAVLSILLAGILEHKNI